MKKRADAYIDFIQDYATRNGLNYLSRRTGLNRYVGDVGNHATTIGSLAGLAGEAPTLEELDEMERNNNGWIPGNAARRTILRRKMVNKALGGRPSTVYSEEFGPGISWLTTTLGSGALGAATAGGIAKAYGRDDALPLAGMGAIGGLLLGGLGGLAAHGIGSLSAALTPTRTDEEQRAYEEAEDNWKNWLIPGRAIFNKYKSLGVSNRMLKEYQNDKAKKKKEEEEKEKMKKESSSKLYEFEKIASIQPYKDYLRNPKYQFEKIATNAVSYKPKLNGTQPSLPKIQSKFTVSLGANMPNINITGIPRQPNIARQADLPPINPRQSTFTNLQNLDAMGDPQVSRGIRLPGFGQNQSFPVGQRPYVSQAQSQLPPLPQQPTPQSNFALLASQSNPTNNIEIADSRIRNQGLLGQQRMDARADALIAQQAQERARNQQALKQWGNLSRKELEGMGFDNPQDWYSKTPEQRREWFKQRQDNRLADTRQNLQGQWHSAQGNMTDMEGYQRYADTQKKLWGDRWRSRGKTDEEIDKYLQTSYKNKLNNMGVDTSPRTYAVMTPLSQKHVIPQNKVERELPTPETPRDIMGPFDVVSQTGKKIAPKVMPIVKGIIGGIRGGIAKIQGGPKPPATAQQPTSPGAPAGGKTLASPAASGVSTSAPSVPRELKWDARMTD